MKNILLIPVLLMLLSGCIQVSELTSKVDAVTALVPTPTPTIPTCADVPNQYASLYLCNGATSAVCDINSVTLPNNQIAQCYQPRTGWQSCGTQPGAWIYTPWSLVTYDAITGNFVKARSLIGCSSTVCLCGGTPQLTQVIGAGVAYSASGMNNGGVSGLSESASVTGTSVWKIKAPASMNFGQPSWATGTDIAVTRQLDVSWTPQYSKLVAYWPMETDDYVIATGATVNRNIFSVVGSNLHEFWIGPESTIATHLYPNAIPIPNPTPTPPSTSTPMVGSKFLNLDVNYNTNVQYDGPINQALPVFSVGLWARERDTTCNGTVAANDDRPGFFMGTGFAAGSFHFGTDSNCSVYVGTDPTYDDTKVIKTAAGMMNTEWKHYLFTFQSGVGKLYVNGSLIYKKSGMTVPSTWDTFSINGFDSVTRIDGYVDDVAIWKVALTDQEVQKIFTQQTKPKPREFFSQVLLPSATPSANTTPTPNAFRLKSLSVSTALPVGKELPGLATPTEISQYPHSTSTQITSDIVNGLVSVWHLNEWGASSAPGGADHTDEGPGLVHMRRYGTVTPQVESPFITGIGLRGTDFLAGSLASNDGILPVGNQARTVAGWIRTSNADRMQPIFAYGNPCGYCVNVANCPVEPGICSTSRSHSYARDSFVIGTYSSGTPSDKKSYLYFSSAAGDFTLAPQKPLSDGKWHHIAATYSSGSLYLYVDGAQALATSLNTQLETTAPTAAPNAATVPVFLGAYKSEDPLLSNRFFGDIDEFAIWARVLTATEIGVLHKRGQNSIKMQLRSCNTVDATNASNIVCGPNSPWMGSDGTGASYLSEELNRVSPLNPSSAVKPTALNIDLSQMISRPAVNPFVQVRIVYDMLVRDDAQPAMPYSLGATLTLTPEPFFAGAGIVEGAGSQLFGNTLTPLGFGEELGPNGCAMGVRYQLKVGAAYYYWSGSSWAVASTPPNPDQANSAATINANFASLLSVLGAPTNAGTVTWRAFLRSDGTQPCELKTVRMLIN